VSVSVSVSVSVCEFECECECVCVCGRESDLAQRWWSMSWMGTAPSLHTSYPSICDLEGVCSKFEP